MVFIACREPRLDGRCATPCRHARLDGRCATPRVATARLHTWRFFMRWGPAFAGAIHYANGLRASGGSCQVHRAQQRL